MARLIGAQVARGVEGTGEAGISPRGINPDDILLQEVADAKARKAAQKKQTADTWKSLEDYRADGWYNDDVALKKKAGDIRDFYAESLSKGINPDVVDPSNPASIEAYRKGQKLKDELTAGNNASTQEKGYFDDVMVKINSNPNKYTNASLKAVKNYFDTPFAQRAGLHPPMLEERSEPLDWYTAITKIKPPTKASSIERGDKTVKSKSFDERSAELGWNEFKGTSFGQALLSDKDGNEEVARQTYMNNLRSRTDRTYGESFDEPKDGARNTFDLDIQTVASTSMKRFAQTKEGEVAGKQGISVEVPGIWKGISFKGIDPILGTDKTYKGEVLRIKTNEAGDAVAVMSISKGKGETQEFEVPYDPQFKKALRNSLKTDDLRSEYDEFDSKIDKATANLQDMEFDPEIINGYMDVISGAVSEENLSSSLASAGDPEQIALATAKIQDIFDDLGIKRKIQLVKSSHLSGPGVIEIEGEAAFDMSNEDDIARFKEFIVDQGSDKLTISSSDRKKRDDAKEEEEEEKEKEKPELASNEIRGKDKDGVWWIFDKNTKKRLRRE